MKKILMLGLLLCSGLIHAENTYVKMSTSEGDIYLELWADKAPETVKNFVRYVEEGFYDGTIFHRVISTFMIQGGGFTTDMMRKETHEPIPNEAKPELKNLRGTIAMARINEPHSATAQFFINVQDNPGLNHTGTMNSRSWGYAVFGQVIKGMDVVDAIRFQPTTAKAPFRQDVPVKTVTINAVEVLAEKPEDA